MAHGVVVPEFWDDERLRRLSKDARFVALYLITGRPAQDCPGLIRLSARGVAEEMGISEAEAATAMRDLAKAGFIELDEAARLIRVPRAPKHNLRGANAQVVYGVYRRWKLCPSSKLKTAHVQAIRDGIDWTKPWAEKVWAETFGSEHLTGASTGEVTGAVTGGSTGEPTGHPTGASTGGVGVGDSSSGDPTRARAEPGCVAPGPALVLVDATPPPLDFESVYALYPRKEGKTDGMAECRRQIRTPAQLERLRTAVVNYARHVAGREKGYIKQFDTFMRKERWHEFLAAPPALAAGSTSPIAQPADPNAGIHMRDRPNLADYEEGIRSQGRRLTYGYTQWRQAMTHDAGGHPLRPLQPDGSWARGDG